MGKMQSYVLSQEILDDARADGVSAHKVYHDHINLVYHIAARYAHRYGLDYEEMVGVGHLAFAIALKDYKPALNIRFTTFLGMVMEHRIQHVLRDRKSQKHQGREFDISLQEPVATGERNVLHLEDTIPAPNTLEQMVDYHALLTLVDGVLDKFSEKHQLAIKAIIFEGHGQSKVASMIGVSQAQVSRIIDTFRGKMRNVLEKEGYCIPVPKPIKHRAYKPDNTGREVEVKESLADDIIEQIKQGARDGKAPKELATELGLPTARINHHYYAEKRRQGIPNIRTGSISKTPSRAKQGMRNSKGVQPPLDSSKIKQLPLTSEDQATKLQLVNSNVPANPENPMAGIQIPPVGELRSVKAIQIEAKGKIQINGVVTDPDEVAAQLTSMLQFIRPKDELKFEFKLSWGDKE